MIAPIVMLDVPSSTTAYDTTLPANGAPAPVGSVRYYMDPTYGLQAFRLVRASGASITIGLVTAFAAASIEIAANVGLATTAAQKIAGIAQNAIADGYWGWVLCGGRGTATVGAGGVAAGDSILSSATGLTIAPAAPLAPTATEGPALIGKSLTTTLITGTATVLVAGLL
jgi:hypothetical protein